MFSVAGETRVVDKLLRFYKKSLRLVFVGVAVVGVLLGACAGSAVLRYSVAAAALTFLIAEVFIRTLLWRVFHGDLNINGTWNARTTYEKIMFPQEMQHAGIKPPELPRATDHEVRFAQDCLELAIAVAGGEDFPRFYSLALEMAKDRTGVRVRYAYEVEYDGRADMHCPENRAIGYEVMTVDEYEELSGCRERLAGLGVWKAKPIRMTGRFWHCAREGGVAYRGTAEFWRANAVEHKISEST